MTTNRSITSKHTIEKILAAYTAYHPGEDQRMLQLFLTHTAQENLFDRKNFEGHITASAVILDPLRKHWLLLEHKYLGIWLPPGGHVDAEDASMEAAALREASEEISICLRELEPVEYASETYLPIDIDSHQIPANPKKEEPAHVHHDVRFLFKYTGSDPIIPDPKETRQAQWFPVTDFDRDPRFRLLLEKINRLPLE